MSEKFCPRHNLTEHEPSRHDLHKCLKETAEVMLWNAELLTDDSWQTPSVRAALGNETTVDQATLARCERYLLGAVMAGLEMRYVVDGDGRDARFRVVESSTHPDALRTDDPYLKFYYDIRDTFVSAEARLAQTPDAEVMHYLRKRYDWSMQFDHSIDLTRRQVHSEAIGSHSEGGSEAAGHTHYAAYAIDKARLEGTLSADDDVREAAYQLLETGAMARANINVVDFRGNSQRNLDYDRINLVCRVNRHGDVRYILDMASQNTYLPPDHPWLEKYERPRPTIKCLAKLVRMYPHHMYDTLHNFMFAATNEALDRGLYEPGLATTAWERRKAQQFRII